MRWRIVSESEKASILAGGMRPVEVTAKLWLLIHRAGVQRCWMTLAMSAKISIHFTTGVKISHSKKYGGEFRHKNTFKDSNRGPALRLKWMQYNNIVGAPDGKPHLVKARPWQEAYLLLRFEASAWLLPRSSPANAVMESPPRILALRWKCLSECQDLTIYPQTRALGRGATTQTLWGREGCVFAQLAGETLNREQSTRPVMIYCWSISSH